MKIETVNREDWKALSHEAATPETSPQRLAEITKQANDFPNDLREHVFSAVLSNHATPLESLKIVADSHDPQAVPGALMYHKNTTGELLDYIVERQQASSQLLILAAGHQKISTSLAETCANSNSVSVRYQMVTNAQCPTFALHVLSADESQDVRYQALKHRNLPMEILLAGAVDRNPAIRKCVIDNPQLPLGELTVLAMDADESFSHAATAELARRSGKRRKQVFLRRQLIMKSSLRYDPSKRRNEIVNPMPDTSRAKTIQCVGDTVSGQRCKNRASAEHPRCGRCRGGRSQDQQIIKYAEWDQLRHDEWLKFAAGESALQFALLRREFLTSEVLWHIAKNTDERIQVLRGVANHSCTVTKNLLFCF